MSKTLKHIICIAHIAIFASFSPSLSNAQSLQVERQRWIVGWEVIRAQTPNDGLSCQARRCDSHQCNQTVNASILLWGSKRRNAITPEIGIASGLPKNFKATLLVDGQRFTYVKNKKFPNRTKLVPEHQTDDAKVLSAIRNAVSKNSRAKATVSSKRGTHYIPLRGVEKVLKFYKRHCDID